MRVGMNVFWNHTRLIYAMVRHLLSAGHIEEVVQLLTDYRWLEKLNVNDYQIPFQQVIFDISL